MVAHEAHSIYGGEDIPLPRGGFVPAFGDGVHNRQLVFMINGAAHPKALQAAYGDNGPHAPLGAVLAKLGVDETDPPQTALALPDDLLVGMIDGGADPNMPKALAQARRAIPPDVLLSMHCNTMAEQLGVADIKGYELPAEVMAAACRQKEAQSDGLSLFA